MQGGVGLYLIQDRRLGVDGFWSAKFNGGSLIWSTPVDRWLTWWALRACVPTVFSRTEERHIRTKKGGY
jgi:hypothetical protein